MPTLSSVAHTSLVQSRTSPTPCLVDHWQQQLSIKRIPCYLQQSRRCTRRRSRPGINSKDAARSERRSRRCIRSTVKTCLSTVLGLYIKVRGSTIKQRQLLNILLYKNLLQSQSCKLINTLRQLTREALPAKLALTELVDALLYSLNNNRQVKLFASRLRTPS